MGENMRVRYDPESDILHLEFRDSNVENVIDVDEDAYVEFDENGEIVGLEIHRVKDLILPELLRYLQRAKEITKQI